VAAVVMNREKISTAEQVRRVRLMLITHVA
jgi:hypothetical protein